MCMLDTARRTGRSVVFTFCPEASCTSTVNMPYYSFVYTTATDCLGWPSIGLPLNGNGYLSRCKRNRCFFVHDSEHHSAISSRHEECWRQEYRWAIQMNETTDSNMTVGIHEGSTQQPPSTVEPLIKQPLVQYFAVTAVLALISLIMLVIHYILAQIEQRRAMEADRKLSFGSPPNTNSRISRQTEDSGGGKKMTFPFILRSKWSRLSGSWRHYPHLPVHESTSLPRIQDLFRNKTRIS